MNVKTILLVSGFWLLCAAGAALLVYQMQPLSDAKAAKETQVPGLKILGEGENPSRLSAHGVFIAYVTEETSPGRGKYTCGPMDREESIAAAKTIDQALAAMPDKALGNTKLKYVIVCSYARSSGNKIGGIPVPPLKLLMLDMQNETGSVSRHLVLHELYHYIEYRHTGFKDSKWDAKFGGGYANAYKKELGRSRVGSGKKGFLNLYAQTFPHEERAEIFAHLMTDPGAVAGHLRGSRDAVLHEKTQYVIDKSRTMLGFTIDFPQLEL